VKTALTAKQKKTKAVKIATTKTAIKGKRGRKKSENSKKSRWTASILEILEKQGKLYSSREIVENVMKMQNIPAAEYNKTRSIIAGGLSDLKLETKRLKSISIPGQKGELYGLSGWFDESGNLIDKTKIKTA
jgi:hypothetical protein